MRYKLLGRSGLRVSELALGTMTFGPEWGWGTDKDESRRILHAYAEAGVIARLGKCSLDWCLVEAEMSKGWVEKRTLWGVKPEEIRD